MEGAEEMRINVSPTPRRIARFTRRTPVLLRVISGNVRFSDSQESLYNGEGIPIAASDGLLNLDLPEMDFWVCSDSTPANMEIVIP